MRRNVTRLLSIQICFALAWAAVGGEADQPDSQPGFWSRVARGSKSAGGFLWSLFLPRYEQRTPVFEKETTYFKAVVEDDESGRRHLVFLPRRGSQAVWRPGHPEELVSGFMRTSFLALPLLGRPPERVLFIGLGGGLMPTFLKRHFPNTEIDIVEIDGGIVEIAENYFGFARDPRTRVIVEDGRFFLNHGGGRYDIVFIDAYNAEAIPFQLTTVECYRKVREALAPDGVVAVNVANLGDAGFIASELKTIKEIFSGDGGVRVRGREQLRAGRKSLGFSSSGHGGIIGESVGIRGRPSLGVQPVRSCRNHDWQGQSGRTAGQWERAH